MSLKQVPESEIGSQLLSLEVELKAAHLSEIFHMTIMGSQKACTVTGESYAPSF